MQTLLIVDDPEGWPLRIENVAMVAARDYLTDPAYSAMRSIKVYNLCSSYRYQSMGYYVSLLAAARGHKPLPSVATIQDMKSASLVRYISNDLMELIQKSLTGISSDKFVLSIYFGKNLAKKYDRLCLHLFNLFQAPFLRAQFQWDADDKEWRLGQMAPIEASEIPPEHLEFVAQVATDYFAGRRAQLPKQKQYRYDIGILVNPEERIPPSDQKALQKFVRAAEALDMRAEVIDKNDYTRVSQFDGLFIRETTSVNHHTYRFARRAHAEGLVVIDDPQSILKCTNKVYLAELLEHHKVSTPRTLIVHGNNVDQLEKHLGFPCVLKQPDSAFSLGVVKVSNPEELRIEVQRFLEKSELCVAQEYVPTSFDWRVGMLDREPIYACKYFMARRHWQIIKNDNGGGQASYGKVETLPIELAPKAVVRTAVRAANLIGDGLYGVDVKETEDDCFVIEVNDNPSIEAGSEDMILKDKLYALIMQVFLDRIERKKGRTVT